MLVQVSRGLRLGQKSTWTFSESVYRCDLRSYPTAWFQWEVHRECICNLGAADLEFLALLQNNATAGESRSSAETDSAKDSAYPQ